MTKYRITHSIKKGKNGEPKDIGVLSFARLIGAIMAAILPICALAAWYVNATVNAAIGRHQAEIQGAMTDLKINIERAHNDKAESVAKLEAQTQAMKEDIVEIQRQQQLLWQRRQVAR